MAAGRTTSASSLSQEIGFSISPVFGAAVSVSLRLGITSSSPPELALGLSLVMVSHSASHSALASSGGTAAATLPGAHPSMNSFLFVVNSSGSSTSAGGASSPPCIISRALVIDAACSYGIVRGATSSFTASGSSFGAAAGTKVASEDRFSSVTLVALRTASRSSMSSFRCCMVMFLQKAMNSAPSLVIRFWNFSWASMFSCRCRSVSGSSVMPFVLERIWSTVELTFFKTFVSASQVLSRKLSGTPTVVSSCGLGASPAAGFGIFFPKPSVTSAPASLVTYLSAAASISSFVLSCVIRLRLSAGSISFNARRKCSGRAKPSSDNARARISSTRLPVCTTADVNASVSFFASAKACFRFSATAMSRCAASSSAFFVSSSAGIFTSEFASMPPTTPAGVCIFCTGIFVFPPDCS
mmetsp:Transcript_20057/g.50607  ORF Transcript_20057/g.50607 Transcript_20057/m.50607 type:complete len:413 (+) Transcript_20057:262-1500(+)